MLKKQKTLPLICNEVKLEIRYRLDLLVEEKVMVELKVIEALNDIHKEHVIKYLKLSGCKLLLLMNFNVLHLIDSLKRIANNL